jgi:hypothetical protein
MENVVQKENKKTFLVRWETHGLMGFTDWFAYVHMEESKARQIEKLAKVTGVGEISFTDYSDRVTNDL